MTVLGYRHTGIICRDIKKSLYFYKNLLGLKVIQEFWDQTDYINKVSGMKNANVHFIKLKMQSGEILELLRYPTHNTKLPKLPIHNTGILHIALEVKNIQKTYNKLKKKGVKFISEPTLSSEKFAKVCFCIDPNNVRVELVEILFKKKN
jgi:catechol 2,3-dioxygenase-like lactoylglutathione lyase family enzyme